MSAATSHPAEGGEYTQIRFTLDQGVGVITLNRPDRLNSFTEVMHAELARALDAMEADPGLRGLVITGAGRGFCAGQDLSERKPSDDGSRRDLSQILEKCYRPLITRLRALPVPVVCVMNGVAAGAGASLVLACDVVFAVESSRFIQAFSKIGLVPDSGGTWLLPQRVGLARAMALCMTGDKLPAADAKAMGMIWEVADDAVAAAKAMAEKLAAMPTKALVATRALLRGAHTHSLDEQLDLERDVQSRLGFTHDYIEGVTAFLQKRPAQFKGE